ncbi:MAG: enoyl-CoA hydratase/isomerase family protein [Acidimicrobiia bacterium]|nr:enoyl-CoA hydratase/isomerase family protein [Acidimicrobiia bacterium]MBT8214912.1 enoyl-CoA hydratase/isomerase family protein [Acidimicrobiia bacterium]NNF68583.1 enoyl-CoA hydratase/isomerase family protein [Acidimicrobiia bacterium]NNK91906.1 enoyl-CoA hydratase/isomerase family protein [Acidimicrobiia bacterium]
MSLVDYDRDGAVALITLNRPPVNALSAELIADLDASIVEAADPAVRSVVITGTPHFAAGADITGFQSAFDAGTEDTLASDLGGFVKRFEALAKPTIAAIRGFALGGGLELALGADFRYLADDARVGQPEILLGIIPGAGGTQRLARVVGEHRSRELCMSGRQVDAAEALAIGLADKVTAPDELVEVAMKDATRWAKGPTAAYGAVKRASIGGFGRPLAEGLEVEAEAFRDVFGSADAREGVAAFLEKRKAAFKGN